MENNIIQNPNDFEWLKESVRIGIVRYDKIKYYTNK